tara:strand:- start:5262 stop:6188 length:927 start_codon:yes stop_codon:yes gene_type:complete
MHSNILNQKTIKKFITFKGIGLHSGKNLIVKILPSQPNTGITFIRSDLKKNNVISPNVFNVNDANFCTTISNEYGVRISTIEHLMAALYVKGVDNAIVEVNGPEIPIMDGSSKEFLELIDNVGLETSDSSIKILKIEREISFSIGEKFIKIRPSAASLTIDFDIDFPNSIIGKQGNNVNVYEDNLSKVMSSRTFCLYEDIEKLKKMKLAKGGSLKNAIVVKGDKVLNEEGLRNDKEFVNHKILDCIGDLYLTGYKMLANIKCSQGGHYLTNQVLRKILSNDDNYTILEIKSKTLPKALVNNYFLKSIA